MDDKINQGDIYEENYPKGVVAVLSPRRKIAVMSVCVNCMIYFTR
jgi:hypothetical protein